MASQPSTPPRTKQDWIAYAERLEDRLRSSEEELCRVREEADLLIQHAPTAIYEIDFRVPCFRRINDAMCRMSGYSREELLVMSPFDLLEEDSKKTFQERVRKSLSGEPVEKKVVYKVRAKDGRIVYADLNTAFQYSNGKLDTVLVVAHDVTEHKQVEETLQEQAEALEVQAEELQTQRDELYGFNQRLHESDERFRLALKNSDITVATLDKNRRYTWAYNTRQGYSPEQILGKRAEDLLPLDEVKETVALQKRVLHTGVGERVEVHRVPSGQEYYYDSTIEPLKNEAGEVIGLTYVAIDITKRKQAEEALRQNEALMEAFFANSPGILNIEDEDFRYIKTDALTPTYFGLDRQSIVGKAVNDLAPEFIDQFGPMMKRVIETGQPELNLEVQNPAPGKPGEFNSWMASYFPVPLSHGKRGIGIVGMEITDRKKMEEALAEQKEQEQLRAAQLEAVMEALPVGVAIIDRQGGNPQSNRAFEEIWGNPRPGVSSVSDYAVYKAWWVESGEEIEPEQWASAQAVQKGISVIDQKLKLQRFDGAMTYVLNSASPIRDDKGEVIGCAVAVQDITRLQEAEQVLKEANEFLEQRVKERTAELERSLQNEKAMRQQLIQTEKYTALARLVGSVAHEINNPIQTVRNCMFLIRRNPSPEETNDVLNMAEAELQRIAKLVQQLRETYRPSKLQPANFNLIEVLNKVSGLLAPQMRENKIQFQTRYDQDCIILHGLPDQIQQVCLNICLNAIDAMGSTGGQLDIAVRLPPGQEKAQIAFHDTGPGIPEAILDRIFEPFFTTKANGTGLGLAICYEIVKNHQGEITVESHPGMGTTFRVWLPVVG